MVAMRGINVPTGDIQSQKMEPIQGTNALAGAESAKRDEGQNRVQRTRNDLLSIVNETEQEASGASGAEQRIVRLFGYFDEATKRGENLLTGALKTSDIPAKFEDGRTNSMKQQLSDIRTLFAVWQVRDDPSLDVDKRIVHVDIKRTGSTRSLWYAGRIETARQIVKERKDIISNVQREAEALQRVRAKNGIAPTDPVPAELMPQASEFSKYLKQQAENAAQQSKIERAAKKVDVRDFSVDFFLKALRDDAEAPDMPDEKKPFALRGEAWCVEFLNKCEENYNIAVQARNQELAIFAKKQTEGKDIQVNQSPAGWDNDDSGEPDQRTGTAG